MTRRESRIPPRIAVPASTSRDLEYNRRCLPPYYDSIHSAGGIAVPIDLQLSPEGMRSLVAGCDGLLLPGSPADVLPSRYGQRSEPFTAGADQPREEADLLLLDDAEKSGKPVLGICYGLQSVNTWRGGTLIQDVAVVPVNHAAGPAVAVAHMVEVAQNSRLGGSVGGLEQERRGSFLRMGVNSSHHQAVGILGEGLRVTARCTEDGVVEAIEAEGGEQFLVCVQWHPERSYEISGSSRNLFKMLILEAAKR